MSVKFHKNNTNFQIAYFLAGSCHTPDAAYFQLLELLEDREMALEHFNVIAIRNKAKRVRAESFLKSSDPSNRLEAEADLLELNQGEKRSEVLKEAANDEIAFIKKCIDIIDPLRQYKDLPLIEAHEASQREEWKYELIARAENFMLTSGTIPAGEFVTMRMHPDFNKEILPKVQELQSRLLLSNGEKRFEKELSGSNFNLLEEAKK